MNNLKPAKNAPSYESSHAVGLLLSTSLFKKFLTAPAPRTIKVANGLSIRPNALEYSILARSTSFSERKIVNIAKKT